MGGIVDSVVDTFDVATLGMTGIGAIAGSDHTGVGGAIKDGVNGIFGDAVQAKGGVNPFSQTSSVGTTGLNPATGEVVGNLDPALQGIFDQGVGQAGAFQNQVPTAGRQASELGAGFLEQAGEFDPFAAAQTQFDRLDAILEPGRSKARSGTASGLLSTGRLGGTAGNDVQAQVEGEIEQQRQQLLGQQFTGAQQVQDSLVNRGTNLGAFGLQQQAGQQALGQGALAGALGIDSQLQSQLALGGQLTRDAPVQAEQSGFDAILQGGLTAGVGALVGMI